MSQRRARTVPGTNAGSYAEQARTAPGPTAQLCSADADRADPDWLDPDVQSDLAYLRSVLDRETGYDPAGSAAGVRPSWELHGTDMPPLTFSHPEAFDPAKIESVRTEGAFPKPLGGLWLTVGQASDEEPTRWEQRLSYEDMRGGARGHRRHAVTLRPDARIARIDSMDDLDELAAQFPNNPDYYLDWRDAFGARGNRPLDWAAAADVYDAFWVTDAAIMDGAARGRHHALATWDFESVVVTNRAALDLTPPAPA